MLKQRTIKSLVQTTGVGLHSGKKVYLTLRPAGIDAGIVFRRSDIPSPDIKIQADSVISTQLATMIASPEAPEVTISTIEHLMSALCGLGIDNVIVEVSAPEIPIMDGSSAPFVYLIQSAGIQEQNAAKKFIKIKKPVTYKHEDKIAKLLPYNGFRLDFTIKFDHAVLDKTNPQHRCEFSSQYYIEEIARARTFGFMKDLEVMRELNLALGGSMDNAIVVDDFRILNSDGLRYEDEFVRHKVLDAVGDLYVLGHPIIGEFVGYKAGHMMNNMLIRELMKDPSAYEIVTYEEAETSPVTFTVPAWN
ncbi:MAG TPA: UDP-3-O-acyl-N-acetylglucosamine deacetylase [Candidatus Ignatzschineria merdigallinarum]|uniref:UDP-3-O-acyl-N-acetylglucosamine deacetylase n=1 Tax=Candidatus Ignatzschineria merdigallinarum TaxID=2838621 RepID=A0A9D1TVA4_9GAMM|nr:UDP-3-O-acyl-N-acetylglucosamine deacetylase [Candidatus Ignatzschineria merdigallinarum]